MKASAPMRAASGCATPISITARRRRGRLFAPFFAITGVGAALLVAWAMFGSTRLELIAGWLAVVASPTGSISAPPSPRGAAAEQPLGRGPPAGPAIAEAVGLAGALVGASRPTPSPPSRTHVQVVIGGAMAAMIIAAIALAAVPAAAFAWIATHDRRLLPALIISAAGHLDPKIGADLRPRRRRSAHLRRRPADPLDLRPAQGPRQRPAPQAESVRLLLNEYEHRGVGWLWQVDAENRVVYISSRMTSLLGRSASQLIGHSLPATLGGNSALGRTLLARQPFAKPRDGAEDAARHALDQPRRRSDHRHGRPVPGLPRRRLGHHRGPPHPGAADQPRQYGRAFGPAQSRPRPPAARRGAVGLAVEQCALRDHVPRSRRLQAGQRHVRPPQGRRGAEERVAAAGQGSRRFGPCRPDGRRRVRHRHPRRARAARRSTTSPSRIIAAVAEPYHIDKAEIRIGVSIGCAFGPIDGQSVDDLIQKADLALYQAKGQGRGTCCYFTADMQNEAEDRLRLEQDLRAGDHAQAVPPRSTSR